ncbi:MAG: LCP family protein [Candidatus Uhrbacteria bacterium]|nr:LCP family protein [Candidatus Uhrbacteria bacterium]
MNKFHINLLKDNSAIPAYQTYRSPAVPILFFLCAFFLLLGGTAAFSYQNAKDADSPLAKTWSSIMNVPPLRGFAENANAGGMGSVDDRINILLMGIGGGNHEGAELTDTIILASIKPSTGKVALFSIPRDLLVNIDGYGWRKVNNANAFGELANPGSGADLAVRTLSETFNVPIQYYVRVDFQAFVDLVNILGGVTVTVDRPFTDYTYPTLNKKVQTISFKTGKQTMDGERALIFARSRHSMNNNEGSDFARSHRQQKILFALKDKLFSSTLLFRPQKIGEIISSLQQNISTNLQTWQILTMGNALKKVDSSSIINTVFDDGANGYLISATTPDGAYVLQPRSGSYLTMQEKIKNIFDEMPNEADHTVGAGAQVVIKNGTRIDGMAGKAASLLKDYAFVINEVGNARNRDYQKTVIYDLTGGKKMKALDFLKTIFKAESVYDPYSEELTEIQENADFLVLLGAQVPATLTTTSPAETAPPAE